MYHDFYTAYGNTRIFVRAKPPGHGIVAHRIIKSMCELIGIKDLHAQIEGSLNPLHVAKAFFLGLLRQRTHQALANEKKLHLVEFREETGNFPLVVASPEDGVVRTEAEIGKDEVLDFQVVNSHFQSLIFEKIYIFKVSFFTKFTISKSHFSQNSHFQTSNSL